MPSDTPTPALTREQVEAASLCCIAGRGCTAECACNVVVPGYRYSGPSCAAGKRELATQLLATMTERDTLRSEVEGLQRAWELEHAEVVRLTLQGVGEPVTYTMSETLANQYPATPKPPTAPEVCPQWSLAEHLLRNCSCWHERERNAAIAQLHDTPPTSELPEEESR